MEITVSRTVYVTPHEPVVVTIKDSAPVENNKNYTDLRNKIIACVNDTIVTYKESVK